jgi:rare lipoprotein A
MLQSKKPVSARKPLVSGTGLAAFAATMFVLGSGVGAPAIADNTTNYVAAVPVASVSALGNLVEKQATINNDDEPVYDPVGSGMASYYGRELAGNRTASGERFNPSELTAAHRTLALGSRVKVTNPKTGESVIVKINDRGPFHSNRLIDLSEAAARQIGIRAAGRGMVQISVRR